MNESMAQVLTRARRIRLVIFDVDGVLTDGQLYFSQHGDEMKAFHSRDGHGIKMLQNNAIAVAIISGRYSAAVERRMADLKVQYVNLDIEDKQQAFAELCDRLALAPEQVAYVGDDIIDLPVMAKAGLAIAVQDACPFVKRHAHWHTLHAGGRGAARDVCELILEAQNHLEDERAKYL